MKKENTQNQFSNVLKELQIGKLLRKANITKSYGVPAFEVFQFLLLLVFREKNLFRFLNSKHKKQAVSKNTYYRFLSEASYNWGKFLLLLAMKIITAFDSLTCPERVKVLVLDDSVIKRNRSKKVDNLSASEIVRIYGNRWSIECFFKASKSYMKLGTEFQCRSYTAMVSHTVIVFTRYMLLKWIRGNENDSKTFGELYFNLCDDIQDMGFFQALQNLMALFVEQLSTFTADITTIIKSNVRD